MAILLQINVVANWGSTGRIVEEIGKQAIKEGWKSYIAYGRGKPKSASELIRIGDDLDMYCHIFQSRLFDNHGLASANTTRHLIRQIENISPTIIHLHNIHGYYINYKVLFEYLAHINTPVIWTLHDCWPITGHCAYFTYVKCNKWMNECSRCPQIESYPKTLFYDRSQRNYEDKKYFFSSLKNLTLVPVSDWLADLLSKSFLSKYPIQRIYNGVDLDVFSLHNKESDNIKKRLNITNRYMLLGVASVWERRKGLDDFILLRKILSDKFVIVLIGLNTKQIKSLPQGIIGITRTDNVAELAKYYAAADVFVNPTWEDNFPTTNLEALACGTPVVTYHTGGSIEAIDEKTGIIVPTGDIYSLKEAVTIICRNKNHIYTPQLCRSRSVLLYNKNDRYSEYINLYKKLISRG